MDIEQTSLFIGRFQPFHFGHQDAIRQIFEDGKTKTLLIGIGSAEQSYLPENPFTAGERFQMIHAGILSAGLFPDNFFILPVRNIDNYALWPSHVQTVLPPFARVYSGSPVVQKLFREMTTTDVRPLSDRKGINATLVRKSMLEGSADWKTAVPKAVVNIVEKCDGVVRLKAISKTGFDTD